MKTSSAKMVKITQQPSVPGLSKAQKRFNTLTKKIERLRQQLHTWKATIPLYQQKHADEYLSLMNTYNEHRTQLVYLFDRAYDDKCMRKTDQPKLAHLISIITAELLVRNATPELKLIFNKYNADFDTQDAKDKAEVKAMLEEMFGTEIDGDIDPNDPEAMLKLMSEKMKERCATQEQAAAEQDENGGRKKSAKQLAKEAKLVEDEKNVSQSIRDVYRKLASALHPDKELDLAERARKTDLMQRVNVAYDDNDLLQLLTLQMEVEQIDQTMLNTLSEDRLKHYNQVLTEQSRELTAEVEQIDLIFRMRFKIEDDRELTPATLLASLDGDIAEMNERNSSITLELREFEQTDNLKAWLKTYRLPRVTYGGDVRFDLTEMSMF